MNFVSGRMGNIAEQELAFRNEAKQVLTPNAVITANMTPIEIRYPYTLLILLLTHGYVLEISVSTLSKLNSLIWAIQKILLDALVTSPFILAPVSLNHCHHMLGCATSPSRREKSLS
jgi:hypothetical protein